MIFKLFLILSLWSAQLWAIEKTCAVILIWQKNFETRKFHDLTKFTQLVKSSGVTVNDVF